MDSIPSAGRMVFVNRWDSPSQRKWHGDTCFSASLGSHGKTRQGWRAADSFVISGNRRDSKRTDGTWNWAISLKWWHCCCWLWVQWGHTWVIWARPEKGRVSQPVVLEHCLERYKFANTRSNSLRMTRKKVYLSVYMGRLIYCNFLHFIFPMRNREAAPIPMIRFGTSVNMNYVRYHKVWPSKE